MEIFHNFGVELPLFIAQIINFAIIFYVLKRFLYKPILQMLKNRENTIKTGLTQAEEARVLLEQASEKEKAILKKAQGEAKSIVADARKESEEMVAKTEEKTRQQVEKMLSEAREQISSETKEAEKRLTKNISELAISYLKKSIEELFTEEDQEAVLDRTIKTIRKKVD